MLKRMKAFPTVFVCLAFLAKAANVTPPNPALLKVQAVYMLPMGNGFDQYIANHLIRSGLFQIVTDPQKADAIFTDHIGESFEAKLKDLYPPPAPPKKEEDKDKDKSKDNWDPAKETTAKLTSFSRGRGMVFLIDRKTHTVLWSNYDPPKNSQTKTLDQTAARLTKRLERSIKGPPAGASN